MRYVFLALLVLAAWRLLRRPWPTWREMYEMGYEDGRRDFEPNYGVKLYLRKRAAAVGVRWEEPEDGYPVIMPV